MLRKSTILTLLFLSLSSILFAQRQYGAIEGVVQDANNQPLANVTVTVESPSLIGRSFTTFTDQNGYFRFPALASGTYEVRAELADFQTSIRRDVEVWLGTTLTVDFTLEISKIAEVIDVTEAPPLIDISTTAVSFTISPEIIHNLPNFQRIEDLLKLTPGVGDDFIAFGADGMKANNISVDGLNISHPIYAYVQASYNYNWIEEVHVTGIGAPAEFGGFTGVAANFTTRSGGDQYHGLFESFFQNEDLASRNTPNPGPETPFQTYDISAQVGGPILKNKLWFFSGFELPHTETQTLDYDSVSSNSQSKLITKLNYRLNANNTVQGFVNLNNETNEPGPNLYTLPEAINISEGSQQSWNGSWISLWNSQTTFEGRFGGFVTHYHDLEEHPDLPAHYDYATGVQSVNSNGQVDWNAKRLQANAIISHHARNFILGSHDFRFGVEFERSTARDEYYINGGMLYFDYAGAPYLRDRWHGESAAGSNHRTSTYLQDEWNISDRFNISAGLRWDHNRGFTDRGKVFDTDPVAPRIGFVWHLDPKSQTVLKAHYGDYYQALLERDFYFLRDTIGAETVERFIDGHWVETSNFFEVYIRDSKLKQPYVRQFSIGIDRVLPGEIPFGAHYIYRRFGNILEDVGISEFEAVPATNPLTGETIIVYTPKNPEMPFMLTNPSDLYRRYDALEFFANKQFTSKFSVSGSFVYSRLKGNAPGDNGFRGANTSFMDTPNTLINFPGRLKDDPTFAWKIVGTYALPWGLNTGWYFRHATGDTWTPIIAVRGGDNPNIRILTEEAGSRRLPSQNLLDMRIEKQLGIYSGQLRFTVDMFNVFNNGYAQRVANLVGNPNFGAPIFYNEPRQMRLGIRYTF